MAEIKGIEAREILDSRGKPTVEVELETDLGKFLASVPSGASKGKYEAVSLEAKKAVRNINQTIASKLKGKDVSQQKEIDEFLLKLDGTKNKLKLGANAILGVSMAVCRAGASAKNLSLYQYISQLYTINSTIVENVVSMPKAAFNIINGGAHAGNDLDVQEFMIVPQEKTLAKNLPIASEIYHQLKELLAKKFGKLAINLGDEGGFAPPIKFPEEAIELILEAAEKLNYKDKIKIILDVASSQFFAEGKYKMKIGVFTREGLLSSYEKLIKDYPILGLEDPFAEEDFEGWQMIMSKIKSMPRTFPLTAGLARGQKHAPYRNEVSGAGSKVLIIGDDLTTTNPERIKQAYGKKACNTIIVKPNQIGTISETIEAAKLTKSYGWKIIVSHRSGETMDDFIADLAVGIGADFIKSGAPSQPERMAKYNRLLEIEKELHA